MPRIDDDGGRGPEWKLDVFVSFRGEELRNNFASHLFKALRDAGIECFRDDDEREIGKKLNPKLVDAIRRSRVSLALFSPRYGESRWCLNELVEMLEFHKKNEHRGHMFMPVFYRVRAGDVRKRTGTFGRCFEEYCKEIHADDSQIEMWSTALEEAGSTTGWKLKEGCEAEFIHKIVEHISNDIFHSSSPYVPEDVVPIESQVEEVISLLEMSPGQCEEPARVIGIHGNRGTGKTTLAMMVYDRVCFEFEGFSFLQLDDEPNRDNLVYLQRKLLLDVFKVNMPQVHDLISNTNEIKRKLPRKKLLIILDNVISKDQVRHFGIDNPGKWLSRGSRIIITTRHRHVLDDLCVDEMYEVEKMDRSISLRLFSRRVFGSDQPKEGFEELCESILDISNVRPSDLVDLASVLSRMAKERWSEGIKKWKKKRRVFCRDLMERVLSERPIPHSCECSFDAAYPSDIVGRTAFLSKPIRDFLNVNNLRSRFATLLIGRPEGHVLMIPLPYHEGIIDFLSETRVAPSNIIELVKESGDRMAEAAKQRNDRFNAMQTWISLLRKMGIVEPRTEASHLTWEGTNKASSSRFTEYVGAQSNVSRFTCDATGEEDEPATDPTLHSEEVLNGVPSEKVEPTPEAELISSMAVDLEYVQRVCARNDAAGPSSNNTRKITTVVWQTTSDEEEDEEDFPLLRRCNRGRELLTSLPSPSFLLPEISQDKAGVKVSIGFKKRSRRNRNRQRQHRCFSRHSEEGNCSNLNEDKSLFALENREQERERRINSFLDN